MGFRMKKKIMSIFLAAILLFSNINFVSAENSIFTYDKNISVLFAGDVASGKILYKKNEDKVLPVASMSKLMTLLVVKDEIAAGKIKMSDMVKINKEAAGYNLQGYSNFGLKEGMSVSVEELLKGMMVVSGNDAAQALAIHTGKNTANFVKMMNDKAKELQLTSIYVNPTGISEKDGKMNKMSALDLFKLSREIIKKYPEVAEYGKISKLHDPTRNFSADSTFPVLKGFKGLTGLKTGFTNEAEYCFTGLFDFSKEDKPLNANVITIVMGADTEEMRAKTTSELASYVLNNFTYKKELNPDVPVITVSDTSTEEVNIPLYPERYVESLMGKNQVTDMEIDLQKGKKAPYEDGEVFGTVSIYNGDQEIDKVNLISKGYIPKESFLSNVWSSMLSFFDSILMMF